MSNPAPTALDPAATCVTDRAVRLGAAVLTPDGRVVFWCIDWSMPAKVAA